VTRRVFEEPDRFMLNCRPNRHLAFGSGVHKCDGATLARAELRIAVEELLARDRAVRARRSGRTVPMADARTRLGSGPGDYIASVHPAGLPLPERVAQHVLEELAGS
jgi:cytochrome P450